MSTKKAAPKGSLAHESNAHSTTPRFPAKPDSVQAEVCARLLRGESITQHDATRDMSTTRLSGAIYDLRKLGLDIHTDNETAPTKDGRTATYARYRLSERQRGQLDAQAVADYCQSVFAARKARREAAR